MPMEQFGQHLLPSLLSLSSDPVANVRVLVAKALRQSVMEKGKKYNRNSVSSNTHSLCCCQMCLPVNWIACFVHSILQGARLCLLWRAGGDRDGSAVGQGPRRAFLRQHGPQQIPDGHRSLNLAPPPPHPILSSLIITHLPVSLPVCLTDAQSEKPPAPERIPIDSAAGQKHTNNHSRMILEAWSSKKKRARSNKNKLSCWLGTTWHTLLIRRKMCTFFFLFFLKPFQKMSRTQSSVAPPWWCCCIYELDPHPLPKLTQPLPTRGLRKLQQALYLSKANCVILNYWINISIFS